MEFFIFFFFSFGENKEVAWFACRLNLWANLSKDSRIVSDAPKRKKKKRQTLHQRLTFVEVPAFGSMRKLFNPFHKPASSTCSVSGPELGIGKSEK